MLAIAPTLTPIELALVVNMPRMYMPIKPPPMSERMTFQVSNMEVIFIPAMNNAELVPMTPTIRLAVFMKSKRCRSLLWGRILVYQSSQATVATEFMLLDKVDIEAANKAATISPATPVGKVCTTKSGTSWSFFMAGSNTSG